MLSTIAYQSLWHNVTRSGKMSQKSLFDKLPVARALKSQNDLDLTYFYFLQMITFES